ncbi:hypothetical protein [Clostridium niameyense]|uniref:hypothetical protein n=1 Tax=Clostridium niameyense TaxID=1622073 RepID=UPI00067F05D6|nr:hypothetical protein [Clostridium niameyense]
MNRYRVEFRVNSKDYFRKDCSENQLEQTKNFIKIIQLKSIQRGKCYYRRFPLGENKKIYF